MRRSHPSYRQTSIGYLFLQSLQLVLLLHNLSASASPPLLQMADKSTCIREVLAQFMDQHECHSLSQFSKSKLSLRMTDCLFSQMGRTMPPDCIYESAHSCELTGDAWNTFSTFYAHIDNLCHFYWEVLHHERAETLIAQLAASSQASEKLLKANNERTHKILALQETITAHMHTSLDNQFRLQHTLDSSSEKLGALTADMQRFVVHIHEDIDTHYRAVRNVLEVMNQGLQQVLAVHECLLADVASVQGMLYFFFLALGVMFVTGFCRYAGIRSKCLHVLAANIAVELMLGSWVAIVGVRTVRVAVLAVLIVLLANTSARSDKIELVHEQLNSAKMKRMLRSALRESLCGGKNQLSKTQDAVTQS